MGQFRYLGDIMNADGGADWAVVARVRCAWKEFRKSSHLDFQRSVTHTER